MQHHYAKTFSEPMKSTSNKLQPSVRAVYNCFLLTLFEHLCASGHWGGWSQLHCASEAIMTYCCTSRKLSELLQTEEVIPSRQSQKKACCNASGDIRGVSMAWGWKSVRNRRRTNAMTQVVSLGLVFLVIFLQLTPFLTQINRCLNSIAQSFRESAICSSVVFLFISLLMRLYSVIYPGPRRGSIYCVYQWARLFAIDEIQ